MIFGAGNFEMMLGGSHTTFKTRPHPPLSDQDRELASQNEHYLGAGIIILRKLRTIALETSDTPAQQTYLHDAHEFSSQMASSIINQALQEKPESIDQEYLQALKSAREAYANLEYESGHAIPPQYSITNLFRATDDMLARIEEKANSIHSPDHKLSQDELRYVLIEFLFGTNDLSKGSISKFFEKDTLVGGILSGGSVYLEVVKKIIERYGDPSLKITTFTVAVDKENKKAVFEKNQSYTTSQTVIITDDVIDKGGTLLTALHEAGGSFPNATIYSGLGIEQPGGFEKRRIHKHTIYLERLFQDYCDLSIEGKNSEALDLLSQAEQYAEKNNVVLPPGWYIRKQKIEAVMHPAK